MSDSKQPILKCEGLTKVYGEINALNKLNLEISAGKVFGFLGHNGAGKTTTIRILAGLIRATSGKAAICGVDVSSGRDRIKSLVGYMPESFGVYDQMRVWEYLDFFGAAFKIPSNQRRDRIDRVLADTGCEGVRDRFVDALSHGVKQMIGIARTLIHDPVFLLLDEPFNGLDPGARSQMRRLLGQLASQGKTILVSSHMLSELVEVADQIGVIKEGNLVMNGTTPRVLTAMRQKGRAMELKVVEGQLAKAARTLKDLAQTARWKGKVGGAEEDEKQRVLRFRFTGGAEAGLGDEELAELLAAIVGTGIKVVTMQEALDVEGAYLTVRPEAAVPAGGRGAKKTDGAS